MTAGCHYTHNGPEGSQRRGQLIGDVAQNKRTMGTGRSRGLGDVEQSRVKLGVQAIADIKSYLNS